MCSFEIKFEFTAGGTGAGGAGGTGAGGTGAGAGAFKVQI